MKTSSKVSLGTLVTAAALAVAITTMPASSQAPPRDEAPTESHRLSAYPLDRSLDALISDPDAQTIVLLDIAGKGKAVDVTPEADASGSAPVTIVTPVKGTVVRVLKGSWSDANLIFPVLGGQVGNVEVTATRELAPALADVTGSSTQLLLAGVIRNAPELGGQYLDASFIYSVNNGGNARSLLESAGPSERPEFKIADLTAALDLAP